MDLVVIAQIITGIATLLVASVLIYQLRIQHNDSVRDFAYQKTEHHLSRMRAVYENKDFREIFAKRDYDRENISDEEYLALDYYFRVMIANQNTNNRLGGEEDIRMLKFLLRNVVISTKIGRYWYKDFGTTLLNKEFQKYADEIYEEVSGEKIGD